MKRAFQFGHPTKSVIDRLRLYPEGGELPDENAPVHLDVVDNKDAQARQLGGQYAAFNRWIGRRLQCNVKPETAAGTKTAVDGDFAAHQLDGTSRTVCRGWSPTSQCRCRRPHNAIGEPPRSSRGAVSLRPRRRLAR